ncbi:6-hydroxymethylpterin diphosphokinase MptE-like protein [Succinivibrio sp.]|uniref:motility associated factor glycosyltransferase family protein n=1 Tax=Succinivibrio sp. TaxID=2053619 RepID=UPI0025DFDD3F|nr:6-hydroxymethylpterin diphosphokinase MptE-like protein [Succinivibrio sp.]MBQ9220134.1 motility associated factor glycosyltransferase family protein [Succinivibrio sp.]
MNTTDNEVSIEFVNQEDLDSFLENRFNNNIESFRKYLPKIASIFEHYIPHKKQQFICTSDGTPNLYLPEENRLFYVTNDPIFFCRDTLISLLNNAQFNISNYKKEKDKYGQIYDKYLNGALEIIESNNQEKIKINDLDVIPFAIIAGVGLGYILGELYERVTVDNIVVVENDPDVFFASLHTFDWSNLLDYIFSENLSIDIVIDANPRNCFDAINNIVETKGIFLCCSLFLVFHYINDFIKEFANICKNDFGFSADLIGFFDDYLFGISHSYHTFSCKKHFVLSHKNNLSLENNPVFVVGSGPSLDDDIEFLQKYQDKALIIACGTAVDVLYHTGIKPDFFANTERTPEIFDFLNSIPDKEFFSDIILVCSEVCHPKVIDKFNKTLIFGKVNEPLFSYLQTQINKIREIQPVQFMNPLVGNMGLAASILLGFKDIYLFGLDNGKKNGAQAIHSLYTTLYNELGCPTDGDQFSTNSFVEANFGGSCMTNPLYLHSIKNLTNIIKLVNENKAENEQVEVYNCSDGAYIKNTYPRHSSELQDLFEGLPIINKEELCNRIYFEKSKDFDISTNEITNCLYKDRFSLLCTNIIYRLTNMLDSDSRTTLLNKMRELSVSLHNENDDVEKFHNRMLNSSVQSLLITIFNAMYLRKDYRECLTTCNRLIQLSIDFIKESEELFRLLPNYIMGDHRRYFKNNKVGKDMPSIVAPELPDHVNLIRKKFDDPIKKFKKITIN